MIAEACRTLLCCLTKQLLLNFVCTAVFTIVIQRFVSTFFYVTLFASAFSGAFSWIQAKGIIRKLGTNIKEIDASLRYLFWAICVLMNFGLIQIIIEKTYYGTILLLMIIFQLYMNLFHDTA